MKSVYIDIMEKVLGAYTLEHIRSYTKTVREGGISEHGFPRLTANIGILLAHGRKPELKEDFLHMMDLCCREIPVAKIKNGGGAGNDFSVKEIVFCLLEVEKAKIFDKERTDKWREELAKINPYDTYTAIAPVPPVKIGNWAAFGAASEQVRKLAGIGDETDFIENQIASQMFSFDENGMYRDPDEPMVYDFVTRLQLAVAYRFGFNGSCKKELEEQFLKSADLTLQLQSVTGEIPYGGRSAQFLHNETFYAALCEFYAVFFGERGDAEKASQFKAAAKLALENVQFWLAKEKIHHVKNMYPTDSTYGCESYAYFDKYMVTAGSWAYLAYVFADDGIPVGVCPAQEGGYIAETSRYFHKVVLSCGGYFVELDTGADPHYDGSGIGRIHKKGAPSILCLSVPFAMHPLYKTDIENPSAFSICAGLDGEYAYNKNSEYALVRKEVSESCATASFKCTLPSGKELLLTCAVSESGVEIAAEGSGNVEILFPMLETDGKNTARQSFDEKTAEVSYLGSKCRYTTDGKITDKNAVYANRNGHYKAFAASGKNRVCLKVEID